MAQQPPMRPAQPSSPEASDHLTGLDNDLVVRSMRAKGIPVTRENYIRASWGRMVPDDEWTPEHEAQLPRALREE